MDSHKSTSKRLPYLAIPRAVTSLVVTSDTLLTVSPRSTLSLHTMRIQ